MKKSLIVLIGCFVWLTHFGVAHAAEAQQNEIPISDFKVDHRIGAGLMIGGSSGVMGLIADININPFFSTTVSLGTGYAYYAAGAKFQYYLLGTILSPFIGVGYAHWRSFRGINEIGALYPNFIFSALLNDEQKKSTVKDGLALHLAYPSIGLQYIHESGFGVSTEIVYLFDVTDFKGVPYFSVQTFYYF